MGAQEMDLVGIPMAMGKSPSMVVTVVISTGRILAAAASMTASRNGLPFLTRTFINSSSSSESFTATPASPTTARKLPMVKVVLVRNSPMTTPMSAKGTAEIMIMG